MPDMAIYIQANQAFLVMHVDIGPVAVAVAHSLPDLARPGGRGGAPIACGCHHHVCALYYAS
jgi:hypothetical protein